MALGAQPTTCRPQGSRRDSISISLRYTWPTTPSRSSMLRALAASSPSGRVTSRSRLQERATSMMVAQIWGGRGGGRLGGEGEEGTNEKGPFGKGNHKANDPQ